MMNELKKLWDMGYKFVVVDDYNDYVEDDFEEIEYEFEACKEDDYLEFKYEVKEEEHTVYCRITDND